MAKSRQLVFSTIAVGLDAGWSLETDAVEERIAGIAIGFPHRGQCCALWVPCAADSNTRILAAARSIQCDLGKIRSARRMLWTFERQDADRPQRYAVAFALTTKLDNPTSHPRRKDTTAKAGNFRAPNK